MSNSELVQRLEISDYKELKALTAGSKFHLKKIAKKIIFDDYTYEEAGEEYGISKHAVYEFLKRLYKKKYGVEYGKEKVLPTNT